MSMLQFGNSIVLSQIMDKIMADVIYESPWL